MSTDVACGDQQDYYDTQTTAALPPGVYTTSGTTTISGGYSPTGTHGHSILHPWPGQNGTTANYVTWNSTPIQEVEQVLGLISDGVVTTQQGVELHILSGQLHREDGPAYTNLIDGTKRWYIKGKELSKKSFKNIDKLNKMQAWELFTPVELADMRMHSLEVEKIKGSKS